jgi:hypothetical protein
MNNMIKIVKISISVSLLFFLSFQTLFAQAVSKQEASEIAVFWMQSNGVLNAKIGSYEEFISEDKVSLYLFDIEPIGFVLLSSNKNINPILAYSTESDATFDSFNPSAQEWVTSYSNFVLDRIEKNIQNPNAQAKWNKLLKHELYAPANGKGVNPMINTKWGQGTYYNTDCPVDGAGPDGHALTGCVATAMVQVMKYHSFPEHGTGEHSYYHSDYGTLSANFGAATYGWSEMPNNVYSYNGELAEIMSHAGIGANMNYSPSGSGTYMTDAIDALKSYFNYHYASQLLMKEDYSNADWESMIIQELDDARPILYAGFSGSGGHAFVCDGYNNSGLYHFNWGWTGYSDGYFSLSDVGGFSGGQQAIFGLEPGDASGPHLLMLSSFGLLNPNPIVQNELLTLSMQIQNIGTDWEGCINLSLYQMDGTLVDILGTKEYSMSPGTIKMMIFQVDNIDYPVGQYQLKMDFKTNCSEDPELVDQGDFTNPFTVQIIEANVNYAPILSTPIVGQMGTEFPGNFTYHSNWKKGVFQIVCKDFNGDSPLVHNVLVSNDGGNNFDAYLLTAGYGNINTGKRYSKSIDFGEDEEDYANKLYKFDFADEEFTATGEQGIEYYIPFLTDNSTPEIVDMNESLSLKIKYHHQGEAFPTTNNVMIKKPGEDWQTYPMNEGEGNIIDGKWFESTLIPDSPGQWSYKFEFMGAKSKALGSHKIYSLNVLDPTSVNTQADIIDIKLYPNPTKDILYLSYGVEIKNIRIYDIYGKQIKQFSTRSKIDVSYLQSGVYFIEVDTKQGVFISKFVKE